MGTLIRLHTCHRMVQEDPEGADGFKKSETPFTGFGWELWEPQMVLREKNIRSDKGGFGGIPSKIREGRTCNLYQDHREPKMRWEAQYLRVLE